MVGSWRTIKNGELMAYEILTMTVQEDDSIVYRYDLHSKKDNFQNARASYFELTSLAGERAEFSSLKEDESQWRLVIEITREGHLKGSQYDVTGEDPRIYVGYDVSPVSH